MTLHDRLILAERTLREFNDHIERGFLPKVSALIDLVQPGVTGVLPPGVKDITVRNAINEVLKSDDFSKEQLSKLTALCDSLTKEIERVLTN